jgi:GTP pyrophosphokinase
VPTIQAGLLHDVVEDTAISLEQVETEFGSEVACIVDGVTKINQLGTQKTVASSTQSLENIRKLLVAMAKDVRVIMVKLADRMHNMRTIRALSISKQRRIANQTLEVYAPIADRLGMGDAKAELEDLAFKVLEPDVYRVLKKQITPKITRGRKVLEQAVPSIQSELDKAGLKVSIEFRIKHIYSLHRKLAKYNQDFSRIRDLVAMRIIAENINDCYQVLGIIHSLYPPLPHFIKDYIAVPKPNGYQSIHTTVLGNQDVFEVQIRSKIMHQYAEHGLAAHFYYDGQKNHKSYKQNLSTTTPKKYKWVQNLLDWQEQLTDEKNLQEGFKLDLFNERIFVFSPKGDLYDLPQGSTPVDFAFHVHTELGLSCRGAKVNGRIVPLDYALENRDIVEVFAFSRDPKPSRDWLSFVVTAKARSQIKNWFLLADRTVEEQQGRDIVDEHLSKQRHPLWRNLKNGTRKDILKRLRFEDEASLFIAVCEGGIEPSDIVRELVYKSVLVRPQSRIVANILSRRQTARPVALIPGIERQHVSRAGCCVPRYPERIVGFVSRLGVFRIHLDDCPQIAEQKDRCVPAFWYYDSSDRLRIQGDVKHTATILKAISQHLHAFDAKARAFKESINGQTVQFDIELALVRMDKLMSLVRALRRLPGVTSVEHSIKDRR